MRFLITNKFLQYILNKSLSEIEASSLKFLDNQQFINQIKLLWIWYYPCLFGILKWRYVIWQNVIPQHKEKPAPKCRLGIKIFNLRVCGFTGLTKPSCYVFTGIKGKLIDIGIFGFPGLGSGSFQQIRYMINSSRTSINFTTKIHNQNTGTMSNTT